jgi:hypothetical protein
VARQETRVETQPKTPQAKAANGTTVFRVLDPEGYTIVLKVQQWDHITSGHPEMKDHLDLLQKTIMEPEVIQRDAERLETHYYYRLTGRTLFRRNDLYLSAVVCRKEDGKCGHVKTAHLVKHVRKDGESVWLRRN